MKNDRKLFPSWWYRIGERDYLSKGSRMKVYIAVPTSSFSSGCSTRYFFCADKWNWVCNNRIVLWTGRDVWKMTLIVYQGEIGLSSPWVRHNKTCACVSPFFHTKQIIVEVACGLLRKVIGYFRKQCTFAPLLSRLYYSNVHEQRHLASPCYFLLLMFTYSQTLE